MLASAVVAHAGEETLYVLVPLLVLFLGWSLWDRRRGDPTAGANEEDDAARGEGSSPPDGAQGR